jgi:hypothetical protein
VLGALSLSVIHERAAALGVDEAGIAQNFQVMRNRGLANRKVLDDVADANRLTIGGEKAENADSDRIGEGLEPGRVFASVCVRELRRRGPGATGTVVCGEFGCSCQGLLRFRFRRGLVRRAPSPLLACSIHR